MDKIAVEEKNVYWLSRYLFNLFFAQFLFQRFGGYAPLFITRGFFIKKMFLPSPFVLARHDHHTAVIGSSLVENNHYRHKAGIHASQHPVAIVLVP